MTTTNLVQYLNQSGIPFELVTHLPAFSAHDVASATHVTDKELAKTIIIHADEGNWMAVLPANYRLNDRLIKRALGVKHVHFLQEEELTKLFPDCEVGAMPPIGNLYSMPVVVDKTMTQDDQIVFNAGTHTESVKMKFGDFENLVHPRVAQIAEPPYTAEDRDW